MIKAIASNVIDIPFKIHRTHDAKADYEAYKELLVDRINDKKLAIERLEERRATQQINNVSLDRQPAVVIDIQDVPLLTALQAVLPVQKSQVHNYIRANKIRAGHFIDMDV
jgi:hypothetical protein